MRQLQLCNDSREAHVISHDNWDYSNPRFPEVITDDQLAPYHFQRNYTYFQRSSSKGLRHSLVNCLSKANVFGHCIKIFATFLTTNNSTESWCVNFFSPSTWEISHFTFAIYRILQQWHATLSVKADSHYTSRFRSVAERHRSVKFSHV
jgi:hypothetical protein